MSLNFARRNHLGKSFMPASLAALALGLIFPVIAQAQFAEAADPATAAREQIRQEERINAIRQQQERTTDVRRAGLPAIELTRLPEETPCFTINKLTLKVDRPQLSPADIKKLEAGMQQAADAK